MPLDAAQEIAALAGNFYVNIHSAGCSAGEIRGQLIPVSPVPSLSQTGLIALGLLLSGTTAVVIWRRRQYEAST